MTMTLARPSIALSSPKATSAIDPARTPAITPTAPSIVSQTSVSDDKNFARPARRSHDGLPGTSIFATIGATHGDDVAPGHSARRNPGAADNERFGSCRAKHGFLDAPPDALIEGGLAARQW